MTTETLPSAGLLELTESVGRLQSDLENIQRELDQALDVWRHTLLDEKKELETQVHQKESQWSDREQQWFEQRRSYEAKLQELEVSFKAQLDASEQTALAALNELDDTWQRDKLSWSHSTDQRLKELQVQVRQLQQERDQQAVVVRELETKAAHYESTAGGYEKELQGLAEERARERTGYTELIEGLEGALRRAEQSRAQADIRQEVIVQERIRENAEAWNAQQNSLQERIQLLERLLAEQKSDFDKQLQLAESSHQQAITEQRQRADSDRIAWAEERSQAQEMLAHLEAKYIDLEKTHSQELEKRLRESSELYQFELRRWDTERLRMEERIRFLEEAEEKAKSAHQQEVISMENRHRADLQNQLESQTAVAQAERRRFQQQLELHAKGLTELEASKAEAVTQVASEIRASWDQERTTWQQGLSRTMQSIEKREAAWAAERSKYEQLNRKLSEELLLAQSHLSTLPAQREGLGNMTTFQNYLEALESEVAILEEITSSVRGEINGTAGDRLRLIPLIISSRAFR